MGVADLRARAGERVIGHDGARRAERVEQLRRLRDVDDAHHRVRRRLDHQELLVIYMGSEHVMTNAIRAQNQ